jgi:hypothetical protein
VSLTHCPDRPRLCFVDSAPYPRRAVSFRPGARRAAEAAEDKSFRGRSTIIFLFPFFSTLALLVVLLMRT